MSVIEQIAGAPGALSVGEVPEGYDALVFSDALDGMTVRIGAEDSSDPLVETAVVATGYGPQRRAKLGVLGPTRMDYPQTMAAVRAVASYLSRSLPS